MSIPLMSWEVSPPGRWYTPPVRRPVTRSPPGQGVTPHRPGITRLQQPGRTGERHLTAQRHS